MFAFALKTFEHVWFASFEKAAYIDKGLFGNLTLLNIGNALIMPINTKAFICWIFIEKALIFAFDLKTFEDVCFSSLEKTACIDMDLF